MNWKIFVVILVTTVTTFLTNAMALGIAAGLVTAILIVGEQSQYDPAVSDFTEHK